MIIVIETVEPEEYHQGPRIKVYGTVVDENVDERGHYAIIERTREDLRS